MLVRTRIAPSPTGIPHIGITRTALFNYLFAKRHRGKFILRIEDTDRDRFIPESQSAILEVLKVLGILWDEGPDLPAGRTSPKAMPTACKAEIGGPYGPYIQSERLSIYQEYVKKLLDLGKVYFCFCTPSRLEKMRVEHGKKRLAPKYDRTCLFLSKEEIAKKIIAKTPHTIRLRIPDKGETSWKDLIHGKITFINEVLDDHILLKSDGWPTYHLAVVVDDHLMQITHVLRGDEWISSTPKHLILYEALGWEPPQFGHLPIILGPDKKKLSKRHGAKSVLEYRDEGYLPEALINFMALLGWSPPARRSLGEGGKKEPEIFSIKQLEKIFDISQVNPTSPIFNLDKLSWFNSQWISRLSHKDLIQRLKNFIPQDWNKDTIKQVLPLVTERIITLKDFQSWTDFFFKDPEFNPKLIKNGKGKSFLSQLFNAYKNLSSWTKNELEEIGRNVSQNTGLSPKDSFMILRIAVTGKSVGPPLFESLEILGKTKTQERIEDTIKKLK